MAEIFQRTIMDKICRFEKVWYGGVLLLSVTYEKDETLFKIRLKKDDAGIWKHIPDSEMPYVPTDLEILLHKAIEQNLQSEKNNSTY